MPRQINPSWSNAHNNIKRYSEKKWLRNLGSQY
jgi:hypothetical protein